MFPELPDSWAVVTIDQLLEPFEGGRLLHHGWSPQCESFPSTDDSTWGVLKTTAIQDGYYLPEHNKQLPSHLKPRPELEVKPGDLLITCAGPRNRCGVACFVNRTRPRLILSGKMYRFRVRDCAMLPQFMESYLRAKDTQAAIDQMKTGISDSGLNLTHSRFFTLQVPVAPFPEQQRIFAKIEALHSRSRKAREALEAIPPLLEQFRQSALASAFRGDLTADWREQNPNVESASVLLDRIRTRRRQKWEETELAKFKARGKQPRGDSWKHGYVEPNPVDESVLPDLPSEWCWTTIETLTICGPQNGLYVPKTLYGKGTPILRIDDYQIDWCRRSGELQKIDIDDATVAVYALRPGDLVINRVNSPSHLGKSFVIAASNVPAVFESNIMRLELESESLAQYCHFFLTSTFGKSLLLKNAKWAVNQASINQGDVVGTPIPLPPAGELQQILYSLRKLIDHTKRCTNFTVDSLVDIEHLDQSILAKAFRGELVPQDPNDEPASVILQRIRSERDAEPRSKSVSNRTATSATAIRRRGVAQRKT